MRTEAVPATRPAADARKADDSAVPAAPRREGRNAFEAALRRAGRGPLGHDGDDAGPGAAAQGEPLLPMPLRQQPEPAATPWAPQPLRATDAVSRQLQTPPDVEPAAQRWQLQILQPGLPAQALDVQRSAAGPLTVLLSTRPDIQHSAPSERLRQRLAARPGAPATLDFSPPEQEADR